MTPPAAGGAPGLTAQGPLEGLPTLRVAPQARLLDSTQWATCPAHLGRGTKGAAALLTGHYLEFAERREVGEEQPESQGTKQSTGWKYQGKAGDKVAHGCGGPDRTVTET